MSRLILAFLARISRSGRRNYMCLPGSRLYHAILLMPVEVSGLACKGNSPTLCTPMEALCGIWHRMRLIMYVGDTAASKGEEILSSFLLVRIDPSAIDEMQRRSPLYALSKEWG